MPDPILATAEPLLHEAAPRKACFSAGKGPLAVFSVFLIGFIVAVVRTSWPGSRNMDGQVLVGAAPAVSMASLVPNILWAQRKDSIFLTVDLKDTQDLKVELEPTSLAFYGVSEGKPYEFKVEFYAAIKKEEAKWGAKRLVEFHLPKEKADEELWPKLQKGPKERWILVDWKKYQDPDGPEKPGFDTMGMGDMGMGDMGQGGDDEEEDDDGGEDDEEATAKDPAKETPKEGFGAAADMEVAPEAEAAKDTMDVESAVTPAPAPEPSEQIMS